MKFFDILKISLKNMWNNKLRTLLVWIVLLIISTIVLVVMSTGIGLNKFFSENLGGGDKPYSDIKLKYNYMMDEQYANFFNREEIEEWRNLVQKKFPQLTKITMGGEIGVYAPNPDNNDYSYYNTTILFTDMRCDLSDDREDFLIDGRIWDENDTNTQYIWVNKVYAEKYKIAVGDICEGNAQTSDNKNKYFDLTVVGIVDYNNYRNDPIVICDYDFMLKNKVKVSSIIFEEPRNGKGLDYGMWQQIKSFAKTYNKYDADNNEGELQVDSEAFLYDTMFYIMAVIIVLVVIISIVLISLSMGAVQNSIQIMVEQNSQFFGMMRAIGMRGSTLYSMVFVQSVIIILAAVLVAIPIAIGILHLLSPWVLSLFESLGAIGFELVLPLPIYLPFAVVAVLVGMVFLWTFASLRSICKQDVISSINEVK